MMKPDPLMMVCLVFSLVSVSVGVIAGVVALTSECTNFGYQMPVDRCE